MWETLVLLQLRHYFSRKFSLLIKFEKNNWTSCIHSFVWLKFDALILKTCILIVRNFDRKFDKNKFNVDFLKGVRILVSKYCQKTAKFKGETNCTFTRITDDYFFFSKFLFTKMTSHVVFDMTK